MPDHEFVLNDTHDDDEPQDEPQHNPHDMDEEDEAQDSSEKPERYSPAKYAKLGGRPNSPTSVQEMGSRKVLYGSILAHWTKRRRLELQMQDLNLTDKNSIRKGRNDHLFVQAIKLLANEAMQQEDSDARVKIYSKILDAVAKVDAAIAATHADMIRIALAASRNGGPQRPEDIPQSPEAVAEVLRESGLKEDEIARQMGDSYPGAPS